MEFRVLGPIEVFDGQRRLELGASKRRAVLALLIMSANRVVPLDRLIDELWGGEPPATATAALQNYISGLRRVLEPDRSPTAPFTILVTQTPGYALRVDADDVDVLRFEALVATGRQELSARRYEPAKVALAQALALWRGTPYADFGYEPFAEAEISRLGELRALAEELHAESELAMGGHVACVPELERLANGERLRERRWELLGLALYRSGRQADALRALGRARQVLRKELGVEPGPALRRLEEQILTQSPALGGQPGPSAPLVAPVPDEMPPPVVLPDLGPPAVTAPELPLVGRSRELGQLQAALAEARQGRRQTVLVSGEPGIGKTRLIEELAQMADADQVLVAWGRCPEVEGAPPYWPWVQVLTTLVHCGDPWVAAALDPFADHVAQLVPSLKELIPDVKPPPVLAPAAARFHLHRAVIGFLSRVATARPLVIVIDDLHWADAASTELLTAVGSEISGPVTVIATYRDVDAGPDRLADLLGTLARNPRLVRVRLRGLDVDEARQLVVLATGTRPSDRAVSALRERTEGNPFFIVELARLLSSERRWDGAYDPSGPGVPMAVADVIRQRLARLPERTRGLLEVASVAGRDFELGVVAAVADIDEDDALDVVDVALAAGVVVDETEAPGRYRFSHGLVQETIAQRLSALRRARLHARVGAAVECRPDHSARLGELAHHFAQAAPVIGPDKGIAYALSAAHMAQASLAYESAEEQLQRALALIDTLPPGPDKNRLALETMILLASLVLMVKGLVPSGRWWERALDLSRVEEDHRLVLPPLFGLAGVSMARGDLEAAAELAAQTRELGRRSADTSVALVAEYLVGGVAFFQGHLREASACLERASSAMRDTGQPSEGRTGPDYLPGILSYRCVVLSLLDEKDAAVESGRAAYERARAGNDPLALALTLLFNAIMRCVDDDPVTARHWVELLKAEAEKHRMADFLAQEQIIRGWAGQEDAVRALTEAEEGMASLRASGFRALGTLYLGLLADVRSRSGRRHEALAAVDEGLAAADATGERFYEAELHRRRGELARQLDAPASVVEASFRRARAVADAQGAIPFLRRAEVSISADVTSAPKRGTPTG